MRRLKKYLTLFISICMLFVSVSARSFSDTRNHWASDYIDKLSDMGFISGYEGDLFKPDAEISRAEFYAVINNMANLKKVYPVFFSDVKPDDWFYKEVGKAVKAGYLVPTTGNLNPSKPISRMEVVEILGYMYKLKPDAKEALNFKDLENLSSEEIAYIGALVKLGAVWCYPDNTFRPRGSVLRAEISRILTSLIDKAGLPGGRTVPDSKIKFGDKNLYQ